MTITKKTRLLPAPFVGSRILIKLDDADSLTWGFTSIKLAERHEKAVVDWGDGTKEEFADCGQLTHTYPQIGGYEVRISDNLSLYRCSERSTGSVFHTVYAPMIRQVHLTSQLLEEVGNYSYMNAANLQAFRCDGSGLRILNSGAFADCISLNGRLDFPEIKDIGVNTFGRCLGVTELHFSTANEETIKALPAWEESGGKFGAVNATVYFDL